MNTFSIRNGQYNVGYLCTTANIERGLGERSAMRWIDSKGDRRVYTFAEIDKESNKFANILESFGCRQGDVFFTFLPKMPEQFFAFLGALKAQIILGTLFSNFGEEALLDRLGDSNAKGIITKKSLLKKILKIKKDLPHLLFIIVVDEESETLPQGIFGLSALKSAALDSFDVPITQGTVPSVLHYTSGSTGKPKGVLHQHGSIVHQAATAHDILGLRSDDIFWCTADQGWVTGTSYGIIAPWSLGIEQLHYGGGYDAEKWFALIKNENVTVWYTAPTALRMLLREDEKIFRDVDLSRLRNIFSVGEPLNPEVISWGRKVLKRDIFDTWFQTETGGIMISNHPGLEIRPGSMGKPASGIEVAIVSDDGKELPVDQQGNLCIKPGWPSMFISYFNHDDIYRQKFRYGFYYTGDTAYRDSDGYYWFMGRSDDIINTAGHLISPFEIESALLEMDEIAESGVIGAPDDLLFEKVVVYIALCDGYTPSEDLELKIRLWISNRVSSIATPQEVIFCGEVPKNKSGKIMRRVLKSRYLGVDPGDTSTLEGNDDHN